VLVSMLVHRLFSLGLIPSSRAVRGLTSATPLM
jgi:hypothetical protein